MNKVLFISNKDYWCTSLELFNYLVKQLEQKENIIKELRNCINYFAIEEEDYSKIYNQEEQELLSILDKVEDNK